MSLPFVAFPVWWGNEESSSAPELYALGTHATIDVCCDLELPPAIPVESTSNLQLKRTERPTMAKGVNKVFLLGNVGKDPEIRSTQGGMVVASFSLATADRAKDAQGNWADKTEWHNIVCFQRTAEVVRDYVKKGTQLLIEGKIQTRSWDDKTSGEKKYKTEILCNELTLLGGRSAEGGSGGGYTKSSASSSSYSQSAPVSAPDYGEHGITDDDIPF